MSVLGAVPEGVKVTWQVAVAPVPDSVQGEPVNVPVPLDVKSTVPLGVVGDDDVSITVAVQVVGEPTSTLPGAQFTVVVVPARGGIDTASIRAWLATAKSP